MSFLQRRVLGIRLRVWILLGLLLPVLLLGILNLFFSTPWGTGFVEERVEEKIGLECEIKSLTWSPWAGVVVKEVEILPPAESSQKTAMVSIGRIQIDPSWGSLFEGKKRWERLEVQKLEAEISIEMVHAILARYERSKPALAVLEDEVGSGADLPPRKDPKVEKQPRKDQENGGGAVPPGIRKQEGVAEKKPQKTSREVLEKSVPVEDFEGKIVFTDARWHFFSEKEPKLSVLLDDLDGEVPIWGAAREGDLAVGLVQLGGRFEERDLTLPVKWADQSIGMSNHSFKLFGLNFELSAAIKLQTGWPVGLQIGLPEQQVDLSFVFLNNDSPIAVSKLSSKNILQGYLKFPSSIQGRSITRFENLDFNDLTDGGKTRFHRGSSKVKLSAAGLVVEDFRMIGDDDAILMNGFATTGGEMAATVRVVASPERAQSHEKRVRQAGRDMTLDFQDLITPDREYRDIRIEEQGGVLMMDLGSDRSWVPFFPAAKGILGRENVELPKLP